MYISTELNLEAMGHLLNLRDPDPLILTAVTSIFSSFIVLPMNSDYLEGMWRKGLFLF